MLKISSSFDLTFTKKKKKKKNQFFRSPYYFLSNLQLLRSPILLQNIYIASPLLPLLAGAFFPPYPSLGQSPCPVTYLQPLFLLSLPFVAFISWCFLSPIPHPWANLPVLSPTWSHCSCLASPLLPLLAGAFFPPYPSLGQSHCPVTYLKPLFLLSLPFVDFICRCFLSLIPHPWTNLPLLSPTWSHCSCLASPLLPLLAGAFFPSYPIPGPISLSCHLPEAIVPA